MDQPRVLQDGHGVEQLRGEDLDELRGEALELVLLDELVQVGREQLEDETEVVPVDEGVFEAEDVVFVVWVALCVQLYQAVG